MYYSAVTNFRNKNIRKNLKGRFLGHAIEKSALRTVPIIIKLDPLLAGNEFVDQRSGMSNRKRQTNFNFASHHFEYPYPTLISITIKSQLVLSIVIWQL